MTLDRILHALFYAEKWNVGYTRQNISDLITKKSLNKITWLEEEASDYSADPFVLAAGSKTYIFYEYLNFWNGKGIIYLIDNLNFSGKKKVAGFCPSDIHLSYPYIFNHEGVSYCIPETAQANEVALYELDPSDFTSVTKKRVLLSGAPYLGTSLIAYKSQFWLFTSIKGRANLLFIFYSNSIHEKFHPHLLNPIRCDARCMRGAGNMFAEKDVLYRPTQNSTAGYGRSIIINKIHELSQAAYRNEIYQEILPDQKYKHGIHNISFSGDTIVIDGKRRFFSPLIIIKKLVREFRLLGGKGIKNKSSFYRHLDEIPGTYPGAN